MSRVAALGWRAQFRLLLRLDLARVRGFLRPARAWVPLAILVVLWLLCVATVLWLRVQSGVVMTALDPRVMQLARSMGWCLMVWTGLGAGSIGLVTLATAEVRHVLAAPVPARAFVTLDLLRGLALMGIPVTLVLGLPTALFHALADPWLGLVLGVDVVLAPAAFVLIAATVDLALLRRGSPGLRAVFGLLVLLMPVLAVGLVHFREASWLVAAFGMILRALAWVSVPEGVGGALAGVAILAGLTPVLLRLLRDPRLDLRERGRTHAALTEGQWAILGVAPSPGAATTVQSTPVRVRQRVPRLPWFGGAGPYIALRLAGLRTHLGRLAICTAAGVALPYLVQARVEGAERHAGIAGACLATVLVGLGLGLHAESLLPDRQFVLSRSLLPAIALSVVLCTSVLRGVSVLVVTTGPSLVVAGVLRPALSMLGLPLLGLGVALVSGTLRSSLDQAGSPGTPTATPGALAARLWGLVRILGTCTLAILPAACAWSVRDRATGLLVLNLCCWTLAVLWTWLLARRFCRPD